MPANRMMNRQVSIACVFVMVLYGCVNKPFQPVPDPWELFSKKGESVIGVRMAMIECGYDLDNAANLELNDVALSYRCMEKDGYEMFMVSRYDATCRNYPDLPACKLPIEEIPNRDPARRLNSKFCQKYRDSFICQP